MKLIDYAIPQNRVVLLSFHCCSLFGILAGHFLPVSCVSIHNILFVFIVIFCRYFSIFLQIFFSLLLHDFKHHFCWAAPKLSVNQVGNTPVHIFRFFYFFLLLNRHSFTLSNTLLSLRKAMVDNLHNTLVKTV